MAGLLRSAGSSLRPLGATSSSMASSSTHSLSFSGGGAPLWWRWWVGVVVVPVGMTSPFLLSAPTPTPTPTPADAGRDARTREERRPESILLTVDPGSTTGGGGALIEWTYAIVTAKQRSSWLLLYSLLPLASQNYHVKC